MNNASKSKIFHFTLSLCILIFAFCIGAKQAHAGTIIHPPSYLGLQRGLVGCWTFDGDYVKAPDCSGNNNTGTLTNGPLKVQGKLGQALSFDGVDDYVTIADASVLKPSAAITMSSWVKANNFAALQDIVEKGDVNTAGYGIFLTSNSKFCSIIKVSGGTSSGASTVNLLTNTWYHLVSTYDGTATTLYVNGVATPIVAGTSCGVVSNTGTITSDTFALTIGERKGSTFPLTGSIDDVRIFNRALSADEIRRIYKIGLASKQNRAEGGDSLDKGLVGHWDFDGSNISGTRAKDSSGQNNHGTLTNGPIQTIGKIGQALSFDGVNDYVSVPHSTSVNFGATTDSYSLSFWIKTTQAGSRYLFHKYTSGQSRYSFAFSISASNKINLAIWDGTNVPNVSSISSVNNNVWHHIVGIRNVATDKLDIYVDGVKEASATDTTTATTQNTGSAIYLGWDKIGGGGDTYFSGNFDDVRIYNRALSAGEVNRLYMMAQPKVNVTQNTLEKGIVGHWTFDGANISGTRAKDSSGLVNHGTLTNGPIVALGRIGQALSFDGVNDYVTIGSPTSLNLTRETTYALWIKAGKVNVEQGIASQNDGSGTNGQGGITLGRTSGKIDWNWRDTNVGTTFTQTSNSSLSTNVWYFIVGTRSGTTGNWTAKIYINGVLDKTTTTALDPVTQQSFSIGREGLYNGVYFQGSIDDVRIYNRALSAGEVNKLWQMGR